MKRPFLLAALLLIIASNAWLLVHVALNRSGEPEAEVELTGRELVYYGGSIEDSGVTLLLRWQSGRPWWAYNSPAWFDQKKLAELGFDSSVSADDPAAARHYGSAPARLVFLALEYDGPAWAQWLKNRVPDIQTESRYNREIPAEQRLEIERQTESRLVAVDAALDPTALRRKYPGRHKLLILRALVKPLVVDGTPSRLRGSIVRIPGESIYVPAPLSRMFEGRGPVGWSYQHGQVKIDGPRYSVTLRTGSKYEPWVAAVKPLR